MLVYIHSTMVTRLLLLAGLFLGLVTPPSMAGMEQHCQDHGAASSGMDHHGEGAPAHHLPAGDGGRDCPPVQCAVATHCANSGTALASGPAQLTPMLAAAGLGAYTSLPAAGRTLQPPTPPPDSPA